jgi:MazG family protein
MSDIDRLIEVMARLRDPESGCPWDIEQSFETIAPYTIEEAYEVADAIAHGDRRDLREELGDLLLQVVFHARMAEEEGSFDFQAVVDTLVEKLVRRHPHVFGDSDARSEEELHRAWEAEKARERAAKQREARPGSVLDGIALALPALARAEKLQKRAARHGFDWSSIEPVVAKIREELAELEAEIGDDADPGRVHDELGDLLFASANLARHLKVDPEEALRLTNARFERRFRHIEQALAGQGRRLDDCGLEELDALWEAAKAAEREDRPARDD